MFTSDAKLLALLVQVALACCMVVSAFVFCLSIQNVALFANLLQSHAKHVGFGDELLGYFDGLTVSCITTDRIKQGVARIQPG